MAETRTDYSGVLVFSFSVIIVVRFLDNQFGQVLMAKSLVILLTVSSVIAFVFPTRINILVYNQSLRGQESELKLTGKTLLFNQFFSLVFH